MKLIHTSDTHSTFPKLPSEGEFVVHSGDWLPNASRGNLTIEPKFQLRWLQQHTEDFKHWLNGRTLLICNGNHDFINGAEVLANAGLDVIDLTNKFIVHQGLGFYGFPYIPYIAGEWNYELHPQDMVKEMRIFRMKLSEGKMPLDILVAHAPPWGVCDFDPFYGQHFGNSILINDLAYGQLDPKPKYLLCGHLHQANGFAEVFDVKISQAATTVHVIDYSPN